MHDAPSMEVPQSLCNLLRNMDAFLHRERLQPMVNRSEQRLPLAETGEEEQGRGGRKDGEEIDEERKVTIVIQAPLCVCVGVRVYVQEERVT